MRVMPSAIPTCFELRDSIEGAMSIYAPSEEGFQSLLRLSRSSIATPPWFAAPVDADENDDSISVTFNVPENCGPVRVHASDQRVVLRGCSGALRILALPCSVVTNRIETSRSGDLLRVRISKKQGATDSTEPSSPAVP
jgi:hypothetical protein